MTRPPFVRVAAGAVAFLLVMAGCGTSDPDSAAPDDTDIDSPAAEQGADGDAPDDSTETDTAQADAGVGPAGYVGVVIGDEDWEFDNLLCVTGLEANESDTYSFVAYANGESEDGERMEFFAEIADDSGAGRLEGEGVISSISLQFYSGTDLADAYVANTDLGWGGNTASVKLGGGNVSGDGDFVLDSEFGAGAPTTSGFFTGVCGSDSLG